MTALGDLTWPEVERLAAAGAVLAVPVGSTEQHGPHLPLSTDTDVAVALVNRLAARRRDVVVAPPVAYGSSGEHAGFAGTISIGQDAIEMMLVELGRSAAGTFRHLLFVSAHGGNWEPVTRATERLCAESRDVLLWEPGGSPGQVSGGSPDPVPSLTSLPGVAARTPASTPDAHAGRSETSIQLALDPGRVRPGLAEPGNRTPIAELLPALRAAGVRAVSPNGVLGDPTGASAAEGAELLDQLESDLFARVSAWLEGTPP
jgi:mycofactocin system creatininase family protein